MCNGEGMCNVDGQTGSIQYMLANSHRTPVRSCGFERASADLRPLESSLPRFGKTAVVGSCNVLGVRFGMQADAELGKAQLVKWQSHVGTIGGRGHAVVLGLPSLRLDRAQQAPQGPCIGLRRMEEKASDALIRALHRAISRAAFINRTSGAWPTTDLLGKMRHLWRLALAEFRAQVDEDMPLAFVGPDSPCTPPWQREPLSGDGGTRWANGVVGQWNRL